MPHLKLSADQVLTTTRAVRKRLDFDRPVEPGVLRECLEIALQAPSGSNSQGWHFVIADNLARVPAMLIPCCAGRPDTAGLPHGVVASIYGSILPAAWSFMLAARERGLGTCWTTLHLSYEKEIAALLGIPDDVAQVALIPIAYTRGTQFQAAPRKSLDNVLHTDGW